jgi:hypothetical protein
MMKYFALSNLFRLSSKDREVDNDRLVGTGREHFARDFPNPERHNCPPQEVLTRLINDNRLPDESVRSHLLTCSECCDYYQVALANKRLKQAVQLQNSTSPSFIGRHKLLFAGALAVLFVIGVAILFAQLRRSAVVPNTEVAMTNTPPAVHPTTSPNEPVNPHLEKPNHPVRKTSDQNRTNRLARPIKLDMNRPNERTGSGPTTPPQELSAIEQAMVIRLPLHSPNGSYEVQLTDPRGTKVRSVVGQTDTGARLTVVLDLKGVVPGPYLICVLFKAEIPDCIPVKVK